jgi:response regulator of citrate/malate metabolism
MAPTAYTAGGGDVSLVLDDKPDMLAVIEKEVIQACPDSKIDKAHNYEKTAEFPKSRVYDLVLLDILGTHDVDLLRIALMRDFKVSM